MDKEEVVENNIVAPPLRIKPTNRNNILLDNQSAKQGVRMLPEKNNHFALILSDKTPPKNLLMAYAVFWLLEIVPKGRRNIIK